MGAKIEEPLVMMETKYVFSLVNNIIFLAITGVGGEQRT